MDRLRQWHGHLMEMENQDIFDAVQKPFFMWSLDTEDWKLDGCNGISNAVMNGDLTDGTIILMHDIHEPSVKAALRLIPDLIAQGYKLDNGK